MKTLFGMMGLALLAGPASAEDYWFALDSTFPPPADAVHYQTADAACRAGYEKDKEQFAGNPNWIVLALYAPDGAAPVGTAFFLQLLSEHDIYHRWELLVVRP